MRFIIGVLMLKLNPKLDLEKSLKDGFIYQWLAMLCLLIVRIDLGEFYYRFTPLTAILHISDFALECVVSASHAYIHVKLI